MFKTLTLHTDKVINKESELFALIKTGNKPAFDTVFRTYYQYLCNYAFKMLEDNQASEEVVQDVFFHLWEKRESLDIHTSPKSYLFRAVHNRCLNQIKHIGIREKYKTHNEIAIGQTESEFSIMAEANELAVLIQKTVSELPTERKRVFELSRNEGLKNKEIAEHLGISIKTVEAQMGKALKFLRTQLSDYLPMLVLGLFSILVKYFIR